MRLLLLALLIASPLAWAEPASLSGKANPCVDGDFLDIGEQQCKTLDKSFGFSWTTFEAAHDETNIYLITVANCNEAEWVLALADIVANGGGTINIEACTLTLADDYHPLPSNILIQGAGSDLTTVTTAAAYTKNDMWECDRGLPCDNVVIRDIKFQTAGTQLIDKPVNVMSLRGSSNLLIERTHADKVNQQFLIHAQSDGVTVQYNYVDSSGSQGIGAKDCFPTPGLPGPAGSWGAADCANDPVWSNDVLWMSNESFNNGSSGADGHISDIEVAGNYFHDGGNHGMKMPEIARKVWFHDNWVQDNALQGINPKTQYCDILKTDMQSYDFYLYRNRSIGNGASGIRVEWTHDVYMKDNILTGNNGGLATAQWISSNSCIISSALANPSVFLCGGGATLATGGGVGVTVLDPVIDSECDLSTVGSMFP